MNIIEMVNNFSPKNLFLNDNPVRGKWSLTFVLKDKIKVSIIAGDDLYSSPRHYLNNFNFYNRYEVAFINSKTGKWFNCIGHVHLNYLDLFENPEDPHLAPYLTISEIQSILTCLNESL